MNGETKPRPGPLTAIAIVAIILGVLGTCGGVSGMVGTAMQGSLRAWQSQLQPQGGPPGLAGVQEQIQRETTALTEKYTPANVALSLFNALGSAALLVGGALLLSFKPIGRSLAMASAGALAVVDTAQLAVTGLMQYEMSHVLSRAMGGLSSGAAPAQAREFMNLVVGGSTILAVGMGAVWLLIKLGFYGSTFVYLRRTEIRDLFR